MSDTVRHRRSPRRAIDPEQLKGDPASLLSLGLADPVLRKLETYRLYCAGYAAEDIAQAFGFARPYLYELWAELKTAGVAGLVDQRWGSAPRTRTAERAAQVLRRKALQPQRGAADLAAEFGMDRSTVYELLKEHGLQDLHRVLTAASPGAPAASPVSAATVAPETAAKRGGEIIPCAHALSLTLLNPLDVSGAYPALAPLNVAAPGDRYTDRALQTTRLFLSAAGVPRLAHVNAQPIASWGTVLDTARRPDADTLDGYLRAIQLRDAGPAAPAPPAGASAQPFQPSPAAAAPPTNAPPALAEACPPVGQIRPGGPIAHALSQALVARVEAGLCQDPVWYFAGHTIEYRGQAQIGKTLHGAKHLSVKAGAEYCLFNHIPGLTCYSPTSVPYAQALRAMLTQAQAALPADRRIHKLAFDKEGWDAGLLQWLGHEQAITPFTWGKDTAPNRALLAGVDLAEFVGLAEPVTVGKSDQEHRVRQLADVDLTFSDLGAWRVVVLETETGTRLGICTTALRPAAALADPRGMSTPYSTPCATSSVSRTASRGVAPRNGQRRLAHPSDSHRGPGRTLRLGAGTRPGQPGRAALNQASSGPTASPGALGTG